MLSENDILLLRSCLQEIHPRQEIEEIEFTENQIIDKLGIIGLNSSSFDRGWKRLFQVRQKEIHKNGSPTGETLDKFYLNVEVILEEWRASIQELPSVNLTTMKKKSKSVQFLITELKNYGDFRFRLFLTPDGITRYSASLVGQEFAVFFVEPREKLEVDGIYSWLDLLRDDFWEDLHSDIVKLHEPRTLNICRKDSPAANEQYDSIENTIELEFRSLGLSLINDPIGSNPKLSPYFDGPISFGAKEDENSCILLCECKQSPKHLHFHFSKDNKPEKIGESEHIESIENKVSKLVRDYNDLKAKKEDVPGVARLVIPLLIAGFGVQIARFYPLIGLNPDSTLVQWISLGLLFLYLLITLLIVGYILLPWIQFRRHTWS